MLSVFRENKNCSKKAKMSRKNYNGKTTTIAWLRHSPFPYIPCASLTKRSFILEIACVMLLVDLWSIENTFFHCWTSARRWRFELRSVAKDCGIPRLTMRRRLKCPLPEWLGEVTFSKVRRRNYKWKFWKNERTKSTQTLLADLHHRTST